MIAYIRIAFLSFFVFLSVLVSGQDREVVVSVSGSGCAFSRTAFSASVRGGDNKPYTCRWFHLVMGESIPVGRGLSYVIASSRAFHSGDYFCVVSDLESGKETFSNTVSLSVHSPFVSLPDIASVSVGETISLSALDINNSLLPSDKVTWYPNTSSVALPGGSSVNPFLFTASGSSAPVALRAVYRDGGCTGSDSCLVTIKKGTLFRGGIEDGFSRVSSAFRLESTTPLARDFCQGECVSFAIGALSEGGSDSYSYRWYRLLQGPVLVSDRDSFSLSPALASSAGAYYCEVKNSSGTLVTSDTFRLTYKPLRISLDQHLLYADQGESFSLKAFFSDNSILGGDSLRWCMRDLAVPSPGSSSVNPASPDCISGGSLAPDSVYSFQAGATNQVVSAFFTSHKGCLACDSALIVVKPHRLSMGGPDDGFSRVGADFTVERLLPATDIQEYCEGGSTAFKASVTGEDNANYRFFWWKVEQPVNRLVSQSDSFTMASVGFSDAGVYFCEARDLNGASAFTDSVLLTPHEIHLPGTVYASAGERLSFMALNVSGAAVTTPLEWYERFDDTAPWEPLNSVANPLPYMSSGSNSWLKVLSRFGGNCNTSDSCLIVIRDNFPFGGGSGDGFDASESAPRIVTPFLPGLLCTVGDSTSLQITAEGGNLHYRWEIKAGGEWTPVSAGYSHTSGNKTHRFTACGFNTSCLILTGMSEDFRGKLRCVVFNTCDTVYSSATDLTGHHLLHASVNPEVVRLGTEVNASVTVTLEQGIKPWGYRYETPRGVKRSRTGLHSQSDLFTVSDLGKYSIFYLSDSLGCEKRDSLPVVEVTSYKIPKISISGGGEICSGNMGRIDLHITDGIGPWNVTIFKDGFPADDLGVEWPLRISDTDRDFGLWFTVTSGGTYTVDTITDLNQGGRPWGGDTSGEAVFLTRDADFLNFQILSDNHIGSCSPVDFFTLLKPNVSGTPDLGGSFFVDGVAVGDASAWPAVTGEHTVRYLQRANSLGCSASKEILLVVDGLPGVSLSSPGDLCENMAGSLELSFTGNNTSCLLQRRRLSRSGGVNSTSSFTAGGGSYKEDILFLASDSCLIYTVQSLRDKHGCTAVSDHIKDTVYSRLAPGIRLQSCYPDQVTGSWITHTNRDTLYTWGDDVRLQVLPFGAGPFTTTYTVGNGMETALGSAHLTVSAAGTYRFRTSDLYCSNNSASELTIERLKPLYIRLKVLLEQATAVAAEGRELSVGLYRDGVCVSSLSCLVHGDGTVTGLDGHSVLKFSSGDLQGDLAYRLVINSAGYLPVMSKRTYILSDDSRTSSLIDFTDGVNIHFSDDDLSHHMTRLGERDGKTVWGLSMVENNENRLISVKDYVVGQEAKLRQRRVESESEIRVTKKNRDKFSEAAEPAEVYMIYD